MKRGRQLLWGAAGVVALVGLGFAGQAWHRAATTRAAWVAARPARPDLAKWPEAFRVRLAAAESRLAAAKIDPAALGEIARLYHANGFLREAGQAYRALLVFDSTEPRWPHLLASLLADYGRLDEALPLLEKTVALAPGYVPARLRLADALVKMNRSAEAAAAYRATLLVAPKNSHALLGLARLELDAGHLPLARAKLQEITAATPDFSAAHSLLATVHERAGDAVAADAERALASDGGRFRAAPDEWTEALVQDCYEVYRLQVTAAGRVGREALPVLERALTLAPDNTGTHRQLGKISLGLGDVARARAHLEKAVALDPREPAGYLDLVAVHRATKDLPAGMRSLEAGLALCPPDAGLHYEYGLTLLATRRVEEAVSHLEAARRLSPEKPLAARDLVSTYFRMNREREAAQVLEESLARHPEFPPFLVMAARYRITKNDAAAAEALIVRAQRAGALASDLAAVAADFQRRFGRPSP
ncbi:MAG TPA: tetratricopeptide repeat protein [Opitutaceae bacterium]|nr:tetratricopeptide repeat protein [Opitutaceae bacterium]